MKGLLVKFYIFVNLECEKIVIYLRSGVKMEWMKWNIWIFKVFCEDIKIRMDKNWFFEIIDIYILIVFFDIFLLGLKLLELVVFGK